jgi:hypothetical protein
MYRLNPNIPKIISMIIGENEYEPLGKGEVCRE